MQAKKAGAPNSAPGRTTSPAPSSTGPQSGTLQPLSVGPGVWQIMELKDPLTDQIARQLRLSAQGNPVGNFELTASCESVSLGSSDSKLIELSMESTTRGLNFQRYADAQEARTQTNFGGYNASTTVTPYRECAHFGVRVGREENVRAMESSSCANDRAVSVLLEEDQSVMVHRLLPNRGAGDPTGGLMEAYLNAGTQGVYDKYSIPVSTLLTVDSIRLKFEFTDGQSSVLTVPLQSPEFRTFASNCVPPPPSSAPVASAAPMSRPPRSLPSRPAYPGHSLNDTYAQALEIRKRNASAGIRDDFPPIVGTRVCSHWIKTINVKGPPNSSTCQGTSLVRSIGLHTPVTESAPIPRINRS